MRRVSVRSFAPVAFCTLLFGASPALAEIVGLLEAPAGVASQISNVQGWAYTTTPGAELIQPFDVLINGIKSGEVPCCGPRGDVKGDDPDIPLLTGFSGVTNWAREADDSPIVVQVRVTDTMGGDVLLTQTNIEAYALSSFEFSSVVRFSDGAPMLEGPVAESSAGGGIALLGGFPSRCSLSNDSGLTESAAQLTCTNLISTIGNGSFSEICTGTAQFSWDRASQGFKLTSGCQAVPRWTDNGDGTATDGLTGLMWELKTDDGSIHDVDNEYTYRDGVGILPNGTLFTEFIATLNGNSAAGGCLGGVCDWRVPTAEELESIVEDIPGCTADGQVCTSIPGETSPIPFHWTSTTCGSEGNCVTAIDFGQGATVNLGSKAGDGPVRAVRGCLEGCGNNLVEP